MGVFVLAALAAGPLLFAQTPAPPFNLEGESELILQVPESPDRELAISDIEIIENGAARELVAVDRVTERWQTLVYVDLPGSTPQGVSTAARAVEEAAEELTALGDVRMIVADRVADTILAASNDAGDVRSAAVQIGQRAFEAGALLDQRRALWSLHEEGEDDPDAGRPRVADLLEGVLLELSTLEWQRENLLESLLLPRSSRGPPRLLLLVQDAMDPGVDTFTERVLGGEPVAAFERAAARERRQQRRLARTISALGWRVYPVHGTAAETEREIDDLLPDRLERAQAFAQASGGRVLADAPALLAALEPLRSSWRVRYRSAGRRDGATHPIDVRVAPTRDGSPPLTTLARRWGTVAAPADVVALRAGRALEALLGDSGDESGASAESEVLSVRAVLLPQGIESDVEGRPAELVTVDGLATFAGRRTPTSSEALRVTVYGRGLDAPVFLVQRVGDGVALARRGWRFRTLFDLPSAIDELVLVVENLRTDDWRAVFLDVGSSPIDDGSNVELLAPEGVSVGASGVTEDMVIAAASEAASRGGSRRAAAAPEPSQVRLLPPGGQRSGLSGRTLFGTVTTSDIVRRVEFFLDDDLVANDRRRPFETRIDLGPDPVPRTVRVVGYDRADRRLGVDELSINQPRQSAGAFISEVEPREDGSYAVEARVDLALGTTLDRVEFYRNEILAVTMTRPPFRTVLPGPAMPGVDFARITVHLDDGTTLEDVEFLSSDAPVAESVVNLVEIYVVVTDDQDTPVTTLSRDSFVLRAGRREIPIERFAVAEDVPLVMGLAVDSSQSMFTLMPDTRRAAARFLGNTLTPIDQAFLVDFDDRPRLLSDTTADVAALIGKLNDLRADGRTALYDAIEFGLVQLVRDEGRRALVVLTDGDDYGSQSGYRRTLRTARQTGVPVYVISMGQVDGRGGRGGGKLDIEGISQASGGRVYYVGSMDAVLRAYAGIGEELRSQYMLGYSTDKPLTPQEVASLEVELRQKRPGHEIRMAVGRGRG